MSERSVWQQLKTGLGAGRNIPPALKGRERLSIDQIKAQLYPDLPISVTELRELWMDIAGTFQVDEELMRPSDRFEHDLPLNTFFGVNDEDVILGGCLRKRMHDRGLSGPTPELRTVDDYIRFLTPHRNA